MFTRKSNKLLSFSMIAVLVVAVVAPLAVSKNANAAALSNVLVRFDRMKASAFSSGTVCARPTTVASTEGKVLVTFPTGYTLGAFGTFTVSTANLAWPTTGGSITAVSAWPGILTATSVAGQVVTFPSGDLTSSSTLYCFNWTNNSSAVQIGSAGANKSGTIDTQTAAAAAIDTASFSTASIADDQIAVTASVSQSFSFALSGNTDALGALTTGVVSTSPTPRTATISTNAKNGWYVWATDASTGLNSPSAGSTIASVTPGTNSTLVAGTSGYNTGVVAAQGGTSTGVLTVATPFVGGSLGKGGGLDTTLRTLASSTGTATNDILTLNNNAAIASSTPPASDYADTITVVGAGLF